MTVLLLILVGVLYLFDVAVIIAVIQSVRKTVKRSKEVEKSFHDLFGGGLDV